MRDYKDPLYKAFRSKVRNRDKRCKWPNCNKRKKLQVHHILPWSDYPALRYDINNGITLCRAHHKIVTRQEYIFAPMLSRIVNGNELNNRH